MNFLRNESSIVGSYSSMNIFWMDWTRKMKRGADRSRMRQNPFPTAPSPNTMIFTSCPLINFFLFLLLLDELPITREEERGNRRTENREETEEFYSHFCVLFIEMVSLCIVHCLLDNLRCDADEVVDDAGLNFDDDVVQKSSNPLLSLLTSHSYNNTTIIFVLPSLPIR